MVEYREGSITNTQMHTIAHPRCVHDVQLRKHLLDKDTAQLRVRHGAHASHACSMNDTLSDLSLLCIPDGWVIRCTQTHQQRMRRSNSAFPTAAAGSPFFDELFFFFWS